MSEETSNSAKSNKKYIIIVFLLILIFAAGAVFFKPIKKIFSKEDPEQLCNQSQSELYDKYKYTVVEVENTFYFNVKIKNTKPIAFTLTDYNNELIPLEMNAFNYGRKTSLGVLVSKDGKVLTNKSTCTAKLEDFNYAINYLKEKLSRLITSNMTEREIMAKLKSSWYTIENEDQDDGKEEDGEEIPEIVQKVDTNNLDEQSLEGEELNERGEPIKQDDITVTLVPQLFGFIVPDLNSPNAGTFYPCKLVKESCNPKFSCALIQTETKSLPKYINNQFIELNDFISNKTPNPATKLTIVSMEIIGYNRKYKFYGGEVSEQSDGNTIQFNSLANKIESFSPIFDDCGRLVGLTTNNTSGISAINFGEFQNNVAVY